MGRWTEEEKQYLIEHYNKESKDDIANHLNRTKRAIEGKAQELKICKKTKIRDQFVIGAKFGKLTIIEEPTGSSGSNLKVKCQCECKNIKEVYGYSLIRKDNRKVTHCGCSCVTGEQHGNHKHGTNGMVWKRIKKDCVEEWKDSVTFYKWYNENKIEGKHLTKENEDLPYGPTNYKFRTQKEIDRNIEQARETSRKNWGKDHYAKTKEFKIRVVKTNRSKYGKDYPMQNQEVRNKAIETLTNEDGSKLNKPNRYSKEEKQVKDFLKETCNKDFHTNYKILNGKQIDLYNKELNLGIEYCGLYWHTEDSKTPRYKDYHYNKFSSCQSKSIKLITIFSDEWKFRNKQVKGRLMSLVGEGERIYARKCKVEVLDNDIAKEFINENHIQEIYIKPKHSYCLKHKNNIVGVISISNHHRNNNQLVLSRLCFKNGVNIIGGASKLWKFVQKQLDFDNIITWSDNRWSDGNIYKVLGFKKDKELNPDYSYVYSSNPKKRRSKQSCQKSSINCPDHLTEKEYMNQLGYSRIWDCGKIRWKFLV